MENLQENINTIKTRMVSLNNFLFIYKEQNLHTKAFLQRVNLKAGVLICSIINLIISTALFLHTIEQYTFLFFICYFFPGLLIMSGCIISMLSIEKLDEKLAKWGYILSASGLLAQVGFGALSLLFTFLYSPKYFIENLFKNLILLIIFVAVFGYGTWVSYCYAKYLNMGEKEIVETGMSGQGLISKEQGPGVSMPGDNSGVTNVDNTKPTVQIGTGLGGNSYNI